MEHLPCVQEPHEPLKAQYLGSDFPDGHFSDLSDFLQLNDLSLVTVRDRTFLSGSPSNRNVARLLQSWFYFGMLREMLQMPINISDFIGRTNDKGEAFITTEKLREYLARWRDQIEIEKKDPSTLKRRNNRFICCSRITYTAWKELDDSLTNIVGPDIALSIHLLATCLEHAANSIAGIGVDDLPWRVTRNPIATKRLIQMGWCPTIVDQTEFCCRVALPYFLSLLGPPKDQRHCLQGDGAPGCKVGDEGCKTKQVNNATFQPKHFDEICNSSCEFVAADSNEIRRMVDEGEIPVVHLITDGKKPVIEVTELKGYMQYTAFSHVWADGRGNPNANALPLCQVRKLVEYMKGCPWTRVSKVEEEPLESNIWDPYDTPPKEPTFTAEELSKEPQYFWFDTLCIPLDPSDCRNKAIDSMKRIYRRANRVIVLDAELLSAKGTPESEEILARIGASHWMRRLWTLQEAVLGKLVYYQFCDQAFKALRVHENIEKKWFDNEVAYYAASFDFDWRTMTRALPGVRRIRYVWAALESRCVSRVEDQPICVAILLDMDLPKLLSFPPKDRTRELWKMYEAIPAGLLCLPGEKLDDVGFTWALQSFIACAPSINPVGQPAYLTPEGLSLTLHGIILKEPLKSPRSAVIAINLAERIYYIRQNLRRGNKSWERLDFTAMGRLAIILGQEAPEPGSTEPPSLNIALGALVEILERKDDRFVVRYLRAVSVIGDKTNSDIYATPDWSEVEVEEKKCVVGATRTELFQNWMISRHV